MTVSTTAAAVGFSGTDRYVATPDLMMAVNAAITLQRPLLIKGEPGTGKNLAGRGSGPCFGTGTDCVAD